MSRLGCKCGAILGTSDCPSPYSLEIFYESEIMGALTDDPEISLHNFLLGWDEKNERQREYKNRPEPVNYWFCPTCKRVYEVQVHIGGRWLRVYKKASPAVSNICDSWKRIYVMPEVETDAATEKEFGILLSEYLQQHDSIQYYLSPDETVIHAIDSATKTVLFAYILEEAWSPSENDSAVEA